MARDALRSKQREVGKVPPKIAAVGGRKLVCLHLGVSRDQEVRDQVKKRRGAYKKFRVSVSVADWDKYKARREGSVCCDYVLKPVL